MTVDVSVFAGAIRSVKSDRCLVGVVDYVAEYILFRNENSLQRLRVRDEMFYLRISFEHGEVNDPGIRYSPARIVDRSCGTVAAENGMLPIRMK